MNINQITKLKQRIGEIEQQSGSKLRSVEERGGCEDVVLLTFFTELCEGYEYPKLHPQAGKRYEHGVYFKVEIPVSDL